MLDCESPACVRVDSDKALNGEQRRSDSLQGLGSQLQVHRVELVHVRQLVLRKCPRAFDRRYNGGT